MTSHVTLQNICCNAALGACQRLDWLDHALACAVVFLGMSLAFLYFSCPNLDDLRKALQWREAMNVLHFMRGLAREHHLTLSFFSGAWSHASCKVPRHRSIFHSNHVQCIHESLWVWLLASGLSLNCEHCHVLHLHGSTWTAWGPSAAAMYVDCGLVPCRRLTTGRCCIQMPDINTHGEGGGQKGK